MNLVRLLDFSFFSYAYIDPSVMTYIIQGVAAIVITIGTVAGIIWRRATKKAKHILNIDENAKKEVEDDIVEFDTDTPNT